MAEEEGFEPPEGLHLQQFSRLPRSTSSAIPPRANGHRILSSVSIARFREILKRGAAAGPVVARAFSPTLPSLNSNHSFLSNLGKNYPSDRLRRCSVHFTTVASEILTIYPSSAKCGGKCNFIFPYMIMHKLKIYFPVVDKIYLYVYMNI